MVRRAHSSCALNNIDFGGTYIMHPAMLRIRAYFRERDRSGSLDPRVRVTDPESALRLVVKIYV
jgi:hypothetical protein